MNNSQSPHERESNPSEAACQAAVDLAAAYSVGATDPEETAFVQAHLAACPAAGQELAAYAGLASALLHSAPPVQPRDALAEQLRRALAARPPVPPRMAAQRTPAVQQPAAWRWGAVWAGAASAAILLLTLLNLYWIRQNLALQGQINQLIAQQATQKQVEAGLLVLLAAQERQTIELPAAQENSQASAEVSWYPAVGVAMLSAQSFPTLPADQVYQLWLTADGERRSGGLFTVDPNGAGVLVFPVGQPLDSLDSMGVTPEPTGGSPGPTAPAVVRRRFEAS